MSYSHQPRPLSTAIQRLKLATRLFYYSKYLDKLYPFLIGLAFILNLIYLIIDKVVYQIEDDFIDENRVRASLLGEYFKTQTYNQNDLVYVERRPLVTHGEKSSRFIGIYIKELQSNL